jgi:UDP-N-acetylmuramoylalanine--D-glutamate ligase
MRILGKGKTAQAIATLYPDAKLYDDQDIDKFDSSSEELTVVSPGIPPHNPLVKESKNLISEYDLFYDKMPYNIWISGTNGKTTTTKMIEHLLKDRGAISGGNIGTPLANLDTTASIWILETSSFTMHYTTKASPNLYLLLPIGDDHLSWHGSFEEYENSKLKPLKSLKEGEVVILPKKYESSPTNGYKILYENSSDIVNIFDIDISKVNFCEPFLLDALLALGVEKILFDTLSYEKINSFSIGEHRVEKVIDKDSRVWINDTKATNIDATIAAMEGLDKTQKIYLILGGDDKGANLEPLFSKLAQYNLNIYSIGQNSAKIEKLAHQYNIECIASHELQNAVESISLVHTKESIAILSPAAASLDQFESYAHRGNEFKHFIKDINEN